MRVIRHSVIMAAGLLAAAVALPSSTASGVQEPLPGTLLTLTGHQPGESYGWAASKLADIDGDGAAANTDIRSARTGAIIYTLFGQAAKFHGYAITDAGDGDRGPA